MVDWILRLLLLLVGGRPHMKSHYRGHHIAVWLQLIPQLHQPGGTGGGAGGAVAAVGGSDPVPPSQHHHHQFDQDSAPMEQLYEGRER